MTDQPRVPNLLRRLTVRLRPPDLVALGLVLLAVVVGYHFRSIGRTVTITSTYSMNAS